MRILALDTSAMTATVAVLDNMNTIAEFTTCYKKTHSQTLMPMIDNMAKMIELDLDTIDYYAVSSGPGSFTGLRIGAATAKGLAHAKAKKIVPVPTLDALAYNIFETDKLICPIIDARRNQVFSALYMFKDGLFDKLTEDMAEPIDRIIEMTQEYKMPTIFLGDGVPVHYEKLKQLGDKCIFAPANCNMPRASSVGALAFEMIKQGKAVDYGAFAPYYIRKSQAEREYEEKNNG